MSLFKAIFYNFERCSGELSLTACLQGVEGKGQDKVSVTLYQHVCVHLCAFVASFHPSLFPELVSALQTWKVGLTLCFLFIEIVFVL